MHRGYLKLWRKTLETAVFKNDQLFRLWMYCLMRASYKEEHVEMKTGRGNTIQKVNPGEFIFGRKKVAADLGWNPSTTYKRMKRLEKYEKLVMHEHNHYSIVTICNWEAYQSSEDLDGQPSGLPSVNQVTTKCQPSNTYNNTKNTKKYKNIPPLKEDVHAYIQEKGYKYVTADAFMNFYGSKGWMVGKNKMVNWKLAVSGWEDRDRKKQDDSLPGLLS